MDQEATAAFEKKKSRETPVDLVGKEQFFPKNEKKEQFSVRIEAEKKEAKETFKDLIAMVSQRYKNLPEKMKKDFLDHNEEILHNVIELGLKNKFSSKDLKTLEVAAILHDMTKADAISEKFKNVRNYILVIHGEKAANESGEILTDEYLSEHGFSGDFEGARKNISAAIREHMGPHPGFMSDMLKDTNEDLEKMGEEEITHPHAQGKISETLLAADMASLAGEKGRKKVLSIRENVEFFRNIDLSTMEKYRRYGISLKQGEAALLSGFMSAFQALHMIENKKDKKWIEGIIGQSIRGEYFFGGEKIIIEEAFLKLKKFNEAEEKNKVENKLDELRRQLNA